MLEIPKPSPMNTDFELIDEPLDFNPLPHLQNATDEIRNYTTVFVFEDGRIGSGVFVNTCGLNGILTAHHVAKHLFKLERFGLCLCDSVHSPWVAPMQMEHVVIGENANERAEGPDLSFLVFRDVNLLGTVQSKKSFYFLDSKDTRVCENMKRIRWAASGSPIERMQKTTTTDGELRGLEEFAGQVVFKSYSQRDGFDYVQVEVPIGDGWPNDCHGMSGGGLWLLPLECGPDESSKVRHAQPFLAGISFYQTERQLTGHGFNSIHNRLRQTLQARQASL